MISVVIPAYNVEKYIDECLKSLIKQTYTDLEIIVVDDGSTDRTREIVAGYAHADSRVSIYKQDNMGAGAARNLGLGKAQGEYIIFLDADDYFEKDMLEQAFIRISTTDSDICLVKSWEFDDSTKEEHIIYNSFIDEFIPDIEPFNWESNKAYIFNFCNGWPWDKLYRKKFILEKGLSFQEIRTSNDTFFVLSSLAYANRICTVKSAYVHHRMNNRNSLSFTREKSWDCCFKAANALMEQMQKLDYYDEIKQSLFDCMGDFLRWHFTSMAYGYREKLYIEIKNVISRFGMLNNPYQQYRDGSVENFLCEVNDFSYGEYVMYEKLSKDINESMQIIEHTNNNTDLIADMQQSILSYVKENIVDYYIRQNEQLLLKIESITRENAQYIAESDKECKRICNSASYRLGNAILFIPKKISNWLFKTNY